MRHAEIVKTSGRYEGKFGMSIMCIDTRLYRTKLIWRHFKFCKTDQSESCISVIADLTSFPQFNTVVKMDSKSVFIKIFMTSSYTNTPYGIFCIISKTVVRNYQDNCEKRCCSGSHKQCKIRFKDHMVRLKIMSLYIYKDLRLMTLGS